jgi:hypothetical protein
MSTIRPHTPGKAAPRDLAEPATTSPTQQGAQAAEPQPSTSRELSGPGAPPPRRKQRTWPIPGKSKPDLALSPRGPGMPGTAGTPDEVDLPAPVRASRPKPARSADRKRAKQASSSGKVPDPRPSHDGFPTVPHPRSPETRPRRLRTPIEVLIDTETSDLSDLDEVTPHNIDIPHPARDRASPRSPLHAMLPLRDTGMEDREPGTPASPSAASTRREETLARRTGWAVVDDLSETEDMPPPAPQRRKTWPLPAINEEGSPPAIADALAEALESGNDSLEAAAPLEESPASEAPITPQPPEQATTGAGNPSRRRGRRAPEKGTLEARQGPLRLDLDMGRQALQQNLVTAQRADVLNTIGFPPAQGEEWVKSTRAVSALLQKHRQDSAPEAAVPQQAPSRVGLKPTVPSVLETGRASPVPEQSEPRLGQIYRKKHPQPPPVPARAPLRQNLLKHHQVQTLAAYRPLMLELLNGPHALNSSQLSNIAGAYGKPRLEVLKALLPSLCASPFGFQPRQVARIASSHQDGHAALVFLLAWHGTLGQPPFSMSNTAMVEALCQRHGMATLKQRLEAHRQASAAPPPLAMPRPRRATTLPLQPVALSEDVPPRPPAIVQQTRRPVRRVSADAAIPSPSEAAGGPGSPLPIRPTADRDPFLEPPDDEAG